MHNMSFFWCEADAGASLLPPVPLIVSYVHHTGASCYS